ncbi:hypothetical protein CPB83DRAFT_890537 [Crepidotus variabilis]|uniref:F-box domain-containing protein n=1 Tax=Crepidotus variabilis TaxID=179855 RepID=A0A9P6EQ63_9AGAR|nr:hypothetical protein CPB83DRAFT_890537 [Crepidotus variabilis]
MSSQQRPVLVLQPSVNTTVVTTTTVTTTSYAPIPLPALPPPSSPKDPKHYPLLHANLPKSLRNFPLVFPNGARATFSDGEGGSEEMAEEQEVLGGEGWRMLKRDEHASSKTVNLQEAVERFGKKRDRDNSSLMEGIVDTNQSRKRARATPTPTPPPPAAPPSPLPSPHGSPPPTQPLWPSSTTPSNNNNTPLQPDLSLTTLLTLPTLLNHFTSLPPQLQSHFLLTLLRHSPLPVLRTLHSVLTPTLARDFLTLLPPELVSHILSYLPYKTLSRASRVSKSWRSLIDSDAVLWRDLLKNTKIWFGGDTETAFTNAIVARRRNVLRPSSRGVSPTHNIQRQHSPNSSPHSFTPPTTPTPTPSPSKPLPLPHPYKLLFKSRHLTLTRYLTNPRPHHISFPAHGSAVVTCLLFSHNRIISASDDHSIHIYSPFTGKLVMHLKGHEGGVWALAAARDTLVSGSTDRTVRVWDLKSGKCEHVFGGHTSTVRCLSIVKPEWVDVPVDEAGGQGQTGGGAMRREKWPKRPLIVTGSRDHSLRVWTLPKPGEPSFKCFSSPPSVPSSSIPNPSLAQAHPSLSSFPPHPLSTQNLHSSNQNQNPTGTQEDEDPTETPDPSLNPYHRKHLIGHDHAVRALAARGRTLVSGSYDCTVRVWDIKTGRERWVLVGHTQKVYSVVLDLPHQQAMSGSMDGTVRIWSLLTGTCLHTLTGHTSLVGLLSLSPSHLVSAAADSTLRIWDPVSGGLKHVLSAHTGAITCFWHDEWKVLSGSDGCLKMWSLRGLGSSSSSANDQTANANAQGLQGQQGQGQVGVGVGGQPGAGTVVRDLLTGITGVWQVVSEGRWCVAASNRNDVTVLDVWDFGREASGVLPGSSSGSGVVSVDDDIVIDGDGNVMGAETTGDLAGETDVGAGAGFGEDEPESGWIGEPASGMYDEDMFSDLDDPEREDEDEDMEEEEDMDGPEFKFRLARLRGGSLGGVFIGAGAAAASALGGGKGKHKAKAGVKGKQKKKEREIVDLVDLEGEGDVEGEGEDDEQEQADVDAMDEDLVPSDVEHGRSYGHGRRTTGKFSHSHSSNLKSQAQVKLQSNSKTKLKPKPKTQSRVGLGVPIDEDLEFSPSPNLVDDLDGGDGEELDGDLHQFDMDEDMHMLPESQEDSPEAELRDDDDDEGGGGGDADIDLDEGLDFDADVDTEDVDVEIQDAQAMPGGMSLSHGQPHAFTLTGNTAHGGHSRSRLQSTSTQKTSKTKMGMASDSRGSSRGPSASASASRSSSALGMASTSTTQTTTQPSQPQPQTTGSRLSRLIGGVAGGSSSSSTNAGAGANTTANVASTANPPAVGLFGGPSSTRFLPSSDESPTRPRLRHAGTRKR